MRNYVAKQISFNGYNLIETTPEYNVSKATTLRSDYSNIFFVKHIVLHRKSYIADCTLQKHCKSKQQSSMTIATYFIVNREIVKHVHKKKTKCRNQNV